MTVVLHIIIPGFTPIGMGRPRASIIAGHVHVRTPTKSAVAMDAIHLAAIRRVQESGWSIVMRPGPVSVEIVAKFAMPASWSRRRTAAACDAPHTQRPDADNVAKLVLDALTGIVWQDDTQVASLSVRKEWRPVAGLDVVVSACQAQMAGREEEGGGCPEEKA